MKIIKFEKDGCALCKKMDSVLKSLEIPYEAVNLDEAENSVELIEHYGLKSTPTLIKVDGDSFESLSGVHTTSEIAQFCESSGNSSEEYGSFCCENGICGIH